MHEERRGDGLNGTVEGELEQLAVPVRMMELWSYTVRKGCRAPGRKKQDLNGGGPWTAMLKGRPRERMCKGRYKQMVVRGILSLIRAGTATRRNGEIAWGRGE